MDGSGPTLAPAKPRASPPAIDQSAGDASDNTGGAGGDRIAVANTEAVQPPAFRIGGATALSIHVCAFILFIGACYVAKALILPVVMAVLASLILIPIVRWANKFGIAPYVTAPVLVLTGTAGLLAGLLALAGPAGEWLERAPGVAREVEWRLRDLRASFSAVSEAGKQVENLAASQPDPTVQEVVVRGTGFIDAATATIWSAVSSLGVALILSLFILSSGEMFHEKLVRVMPRLRDKKTALRIVLSVERSISRYLLTVTLINIGLGIAVGAAMWLLGMPNPAIWGTAATLLNFLPYIGAIIGVTLVGAVAIVSFDTVTQAIFVPLVYLSLTTLEGQVVTPVLVGRRLEINTVAVLLGVAFWGWLWGIVGVLLAVPILVMIKQIAEHLPSWRALDEFLSSANTQREEPADAPPSAEKPG